VGPQGRHLARADERRRADENLEQHAAERVDVHPRVAAHAPDELRRHVVQRSEQLAGPGQLRRVARLDREAEVREEGVLAPATRRRQDVLRLDVPVHEAVRVRGVESGGDLGDEVRRARRFQRGLARDDLLQRRPVDVLHGDVQQAVVLADVIHGQHVRMLDRGHHLLLPAEARAERRLVADVGAEHLQRDGPLERDLRRAKDDAHPASPQRGVDAVAGERRADLQGPEARARTASAGDRGWTRHVSRPRVTDRRAARGEGSSPGRAALVQGRVHVDGTCF
jgi:hypothetical protein